MKKDSPKRVENQKLEKHNKCIQEVLATVNILINSSWNLDCSHTICNERKDEAGI